MSRPAIEAFALRAVGEAIRVYANNMAGDAHLREHLEALAEHLEETAHDVARVAKISHVLVRG